MSKTMPEIRINFSWLFYDDVSKQICKHNKWPINEPEECEELTEKIREKWSKVETKVLTAMQDITGLEFYRPVIDVITAPGIIPKSEPLLLNFKELDLVVDTLTHELLHVLLTDNKIVSIYGNYRDKKLGYKWMDLFGFDDDYNALVHVPVHAIHQKIMVEVLDDPDGPARDIALMKRYGAESYLKSWDYVQSEGADTIIGKLKKSYAEIAKELEVEK